jgi:hypothetical protein
MTALAKERASSVREVTRDLRPLAANAKVFKGALAVCINGGTSKGFYQQGSLAIAGVAVGRFTQTVDNTGGADGALTAEIHFFEERHLFLLANDAGTPVAVADREGLCYVFDDQTVTQAAGATTEAGVVYDVTTEGVWVAIREVLPAETSAPRIQSGTSTLVAGTKTVNGVVLTATSRIVVTMKDPGAGAITGMGALDVPVAGRTVGNAGSFIVNAIDDSKATIATAVSTFDYVIIG